MRMSPGQGNAAGEKWTIRADKPADKTATTKDRGRPELDYMQV